MAVVTGGISNGTVSLDYKFEFPVSNGTQWAVGKVVLSDTFTHDGDSWQLATTKMLDPTSRNDYLECKLHLVQSSNTKKKVARVCHFSEGGTILSSPTAIFFHSGDKSQSWSSWFNHTRGETIIVEVLESIEVEV